MKPVVLISGVSRGIGLGLAQFFLKEGWQVVGISRSTPEALGNEAAFQHFCANITDEAKIKEIFKQIRKQFAGLDLLINNAGIASMNQASFTPLATVRKILETNVVGTFLLIREATKLLRQRGGSIINFSSCAVPYSLPGEAIYAASKAAVETLTRVLAKELYPHGIRINTIAPPMVKTDLIKNVPQAALDRLLSRSAIQHVGEAEDIAKTIRFLVSQDARMVTGQTVYLGGVV